MTLFRNPIGPVLFKVLLTGLVVTRISGSPLQASEHRASDRHVEQSVESGIPRIEGDQSSAAPAYHAFAPASSDHPDGVCAVSYTHLTLPTIYSV